ncbi:hypothetical protein HN51_042976, partial [Arachis hypogaea]
QDAIQGTRLTQANLDAVVCKHMRCKTHKVTEIFQPMWTDEHFYLMVVDVRRKKLMYFDSFKCTTETECRKLAMTQALHLESLTIGPKWLSKCTAERPRFSSYDFEEPVVPQQHRLSGALWAIHSVTEVNDLTRMRIALDLVLRSHNAKAINVVEKAMCYWRKKAGSSRHGRQR